jgi:hypothetical protein
MLANGDDLERFAARRRAAMSRRRLLQVGALGLTGLTLPRLFAARAESGQPAIQPRADSCILIFLNGGPSHHDMWDMKPAEAEGIRGEFKPISTSLPGYQICELLPRLAREMHRATVVRSMHHSVNNAHALAVYTSMTGHDRGDANRIVGNSQDDYPTPGAALSMFRPPTRPIVPQVHLPYKTKEGASGPPQPGFFGGFLGGAHDPLFVLRDPNAANFSVPELTLIAGVDDERLAARRELFKNIDKQLRDKQGRAVIDAMDGFQQRALDLLTSPVTQRAFRLQEEPDTVRNAYGRNIYGQSGLLARRLIEAGTRMVTLSWAPDANATWDTHGQNFKKLKQTLLPQFDAVISNLVTDFEQRGLLDRTLIVVLGDFGRTPKVNKNAGRDHWNYCYSQMLIGGGMKAGLIYGASDKIGAFPADNPLVPGDIISTMYHALGIRHDQVLYDQLNRPHRLVPAGDVVHELLA